MKKTIFSISLAFVCTMALQAQNSVALTQVGNGNDVQFEFVAASGNMLEATQLGDDNSASLTFYANDNSVMLWQLGLENQSHLTLEGGGSNLVSIAQLGMQNNSALYISGFGNSIEAQQGGIENNLTLFLDGFGEGSTQAFFQQVGAYNAINAMLMGGTVGEFLQWGIQNTLSVDVPHGSPEVFSLQLGLYNQLKMTAEFGIRHAAQQMGNYNIAYQLGSLGEMRILQQGDYNIAQQQGFNNASVYQLSGIQQGKGNSLYQAATFVGESVLEAIQLGDYNAAEQISTDGQVWGDIYQEGNYNTASATTSGGNYYYYGIVQEGNNNTASVVQTGNNSQQLSEAWIGQYGNNNKAAIEQHGFQKSLILQTGNNNSTAILGR